MLKSATHPHRCVALLPFTLTAQKPRERAYPTKLVTLGDHIKKRRLDLGLPQKDVAGAIGVDTCTITHWEKNRTRPPLRFIPRIIDFLGYEPPSPPPRTLGGKIKGYRHQKGITQEELARRIGVDPGTLSRLEANRGKCLPSVKRKGAAFLDAHPSISCGLNE